MAEALITVPQALAEMRLAPPSKVGDRLFKWLTMIMGLSVGALIVLVGFTLWRGAAPSVHHFGPRFLTSSTWDPVQEVFGALPFIYGTLVSSLIGLVIAQGLLGAAQFFTGVPAVLVAFHVAGAAACTAATAALWASMRQRTEPKTLES